MPTITRPRLRYFDMLKGVAIFLVVMGHVITFCIRGLDYAFIFKLIGAVHMPIFFFVSGWFTYKITDGQLMFPKIKDRAIQLLLPTIVVGSLWVLYFPHSFLESPLDSTFKGIIFDSMKNGYWFTITLFEFMLLYAAMVKPLRMAKNWMQWLSIIIVVYIALTAALKMLNDTDIANLLGLQPLVTFYAVFFFGVTARKYKDQFMRAIECSWLQTCAILIFVAVLYVASWWWEFSFINDLTFLITYVILHLSLLTFIMPVFMKWDSAANAPEASSLAKKIAHFWEYLGTQSLAIYLLHYFLLFPLYIVRPWFDSTHAAIVPMAAFSAAWSLAIIAVTLLFIKLIEPSKQLTLLLTGKRASK